MLGVQVRIWNIETIAGSCAQCPQIEHIRRSKTETCVCDELPGLVEIRDPADIAANVICVDRRGGRNGRLRQPYGNVAQSQAARKRSRQSRSAVVQDALRHWLRLQTRLDLVRDYERGYGRHPEGQREVDAALATAGFVFSDDDGKDEW